MGDQNLLAINATHCGNAATAHLRFFASECMRTTIIAIIPHYKAIPYVKFQVSCRICLHMRCVYVVNLKPSKAMSNLGIMLNGAAYRRAKAANYTDMLINWCS